MQKQPDSDPKSENQAIRQRIKLAIETKGMKIKQFARESGMAYPSLRDYYSGLRKPGFNAIASILRFTGVSGDWLLIGKGVMFPDREPKMANVDEALMGQITQAVERAFLAEEPSWEDMDRVADQDDGDYLYALPKKEFQKNLNKIGERSVIAASVYNRVAHIQDLKDRDEAVIREVANLVRLNRGISATQIKDE